MPKFRNKPVVIQAVQLNWRNWPDVCALLGDTLDPDKGGRGARHMPIDAAPSDACGETAPFIELDVTTVHGETAIVRHGDWIIPDGKPGTFYPCKPDIFAAKYELIEEMAEVAR